PISQRLVGETTAAPASSRAFVLPSRYGMAIMEIRGASPRIPTHFCVRRTPGQPRRTPFAWSRSRAATGFARLLQLDLGASLLELGLDLLGLVLVHAFLDRLRRAFDEVLGFLEAQAGDGADFLDDFDLLLAGGGKNDRELGLFLGRSSGGAATSGPCNRNGGRGGHAPLLFEELCE